jgi:hypothetical protein
MTNGFEDWLDKFGWREGFEENLTKAQRVQIRRLIVYLEERQVRLDAVDWGDFIQRRFAGSRSRAAVKNAVVDLERALGKLVGGDWRHIGDSRVRRHPLPEMEAVVPTPWIATVRALDSRGRGAVVALCDVAGGPSAGDLVLTEPLLDEAVDRRRRSIDPHEHWGATRRRAFGQVLYNALHRLDPTLDLDLLCRHFALTSNLHAVRHLPFERWPRPMQQRAIDSDADAERIIGRYLLFLSTTQRPLETISQDALLLWAQSGAESTATAICRLEELAAHLPTVTPGCEAVCRSAVRAMTARRYAEYTAHYDRERRNHRTRKTGWHLAVPRHSWPSAWREAFDAFEARCNSDGTAVDLRRALLGGQSTRQRRIARSSLEQIERTVGELLHAARSDSRLETSDELNPATIQCYIDAQRARGCRPATLSMRVKWLNSFAEKILCLPRDQRDWLPLTYRHLAKEQAKHERRKLSKQLPTLSQVWHVGQQLWKQANEGPKHTTLAFRKARDGLLICLSCNVPARANELSTLRFGRELARTADGWSIDFIQPKTGRRYRNGTVWPEVRQMLDTYVATWLPSISDGDWVWMDHRPSDRWVRTVFEYRVGINPHAIRDIVATGYTIHGIDRAQAIPSVLGHADPRTAEAYIRASRILSAAERARALLFQRCDLE